MRRLPARPAARRRRRRRRQLGRGEVLTDEHELVPLEIVAPDESWRVSKDEFVTRFTLLGLPLGDDRFEIRGGYVAFANRGDVVRYDGPTGDVEIVEPGGHTTLGLCFKRAATADVVEHVVDDLRLTGALAENTAGRFWLVDVPPATDPAAVEAVLEGHRVGGALEWRRATGVELLPWLATEARGDRRSERARTRLRRISWLGP